MQSRGINLGPTGAGTGAGGHGHGRKRGRGRKAKVAAPKLVYTMPHKALHNLIN